MILLQFLFGSFKTGLLAGSSEIMLYLQLFFEFFKTGLFAVGGGYATIPFLMDMTVTHDWFTKSDLAGMIAISESTPGPIGINMATYVGYQTGGIFGSVLATFALVLPSFIIILIIARILKKFRDSKYVQNAFFGIRPAVAALITYAVYQLVALAVVNTSSEGTKASIPAIVMIAVIFGLLQVKKIKKVHPVAWVGIGALLGILFRL